MDELQMQLIAMKQVFSAASETDKPGLQMMIDQLEQLLEFQQDEQHESSGNIESTSSVNYNSNSNVVESQEDEEFRRFQV